MIALDSNVVIRLLVGDDPGQEKLAKDLVARAAEQGEACLVTNSVLCEIEWVLGSSYNARRPEILSALQHLLGNPLFDFEDRSAMLHALDGYSEGKGDFSDHLIGAVGTARGARATYTFDRAFRDRQGFVLLR